jgi:hypothetical protein
MFFIMYLVWEKGRKEILLSFKTNFVKLDTSRVTAQIPMDVVNMPSKRLKIFSPLGGQSAKYKITLFANSSPSASPHYDAKLPKLSVLFLKFVT